MFEDGIEQGLAILEVPVKLPLVTPQRLARTSTRKPVTPSLARTSIAASTQRFGSSCVRAAGALRRGVAGGDFAKT